MVAAKIDIAGRLEYLANSAYQAQQKPAGDALAQAARMVRGALAAAEAKETLRDRLAMAALTGLMVNNPQSLSMAERAYEIADAMLAVRQIQK